MTRRRQTGFQTRTKSTPLLRIVLLALFIVFLLLAILPITQWLSGDPTARNVRSIDTVSLPPPEPPPPEPPPPEEDEPEEVDDYEEPPPPLNLAQLEASLNPSAGSALAGAFGVGNFALSGPDTIGDMQVFQLADLDSRPKRIKTILPEYPPALRRERIEGTVRVKLRINENGQARVVQIIESPDPRFNDGVREALNQWVFEPPMKDGVKVIAEYEQPLPFTL